MAGLLGEYPVLDDPTLPLLVGINSDVPAADPYAVGGAEKTSQETPWQPAESGPDTRGIGERVNDWIGLFGRGLGAGGSAGGSLGEAGDRAAAMRNLMAFGTALLANSGPSTTRRSFGQILATGLDAAGQAQAQSEARALASREQDIKTRLALATYGLHERGVSLQERTAALKEAQIKAGMKATETALGLIGGEGGGGGGSTGASVTPGLAPGLAALPAPQSRADLASFQSPELRTLITKTATDEGGPITPQIALAFAHQESSGNPNVAAGDGGRSVGPFQIGQEEAAGVGVTDRSSVVNNVQAGVRYLNYLARKYDGDMDKVALAYNAGVGRADAVIGGTAAIPDSTRQYVANIRQMTGWKGAAPTTGKPAPVDAGGDSDGGGGGGDAVPPPQGRADSPIAPAGDWRRRTSEPTTIGKVKVDAPTSDLIRDLPPAVQRVFRARIAASAAATDPAAALQSTLKDLADTAIKYHDDRVTPLDEDAAKAEMGPAYDPTAKYGRKGNGDITVIQQGRAPIPYGETAAGMADKLMHARATKDLEGYGQRSTKAGTLLGNVDMLRGVSRNLGDATILGRIGPVAEMAVALGFGSKEQVAKIGNVQLFNALTARLAQDLHGTGMGSQSDFELRNQMAMIPNPGQTPEAREAMLALLSTYGKRQQEEDRLAGEFFAANHHTIGMDAFIRNRLGPVLKTAPPAGDLKARQEFAKRLGDNEAFIVADDPEYPQGYVTYMRR